jgi:hypothetical protein
MNADRLEELDVRKPTGQSLARATHRRPLRWAARRTSRLVVSVRTDSGAWPVQQLRRGKLDGGQKWHIVLPCRRDLVRWPGVFLQRVHVSVSA